MLDDDNVGHCLGWRPSFIIAIPLLIRLAGEGSEKFPNACLRCRYRYFINVRVFAAAS
jgi:hypothetical protein